MKNNLTAAEQGRYVQNLFSRIAPRYDLMNRLMTAGQDQNWRREVIRLAQPFAGATLLDLGAGTGDLAREALRQEPACRPLAADFTLQMMLAGEHTAGLAWSAADALDLPFADDRFDIIVSGFLLRNVTDLARCLRELLRVLKPGGRLVTLDTTRPGGSIWAPFTRLYMHTFVPLMGSLLTGQRDAYTYLPDTTDHFLSAEELAGKMRAAGFEQVAFRRRMFGTVAIHSAEKGKTA